MKQEKAKIKSKSKIGKKKSRKRIADIQPLKKVEKKLPSLPNENDLTSENGNSVAMSIGIDVDKIRELYASGNSISF